MRKFPVYVILTGILLVLSSGIHVTYTLYRMASLEPSAQFDLLPHHTARAQMVVQEHDEVMPSIYLEVAEADARVHAAQYSYTFTSNGESLRQGSGVIDQNSADKNTRTSTTSTALQVERYLPTLKFKANQKTLFVDIRLDEINKVGKLLVAEARFYLDPPLFRLSFLSLILVWTMGILLVLVGAIQWTRSVKAPTFNSTSEAGVKRVRFWHMLCHLSALLGYVFPFGHVLGPLLVWLFRRDRIPGVEAAGRESLNFQLTVTLMGLIGVMLSVIFVGLILLFLVVVFHFCMTLYASRRAQRGQDVAYPLNVRIIKY